MANKTVSSRLQILEGQLKISLDRSRAEFQHAGIKGGSIEAGMRDFLQAHVPINQSVGTGELIDLYGSRSGQVDIVIANEGHPFKYPTHEAGLYLVEGVAAGIEVKANLTSSHLQSAINGAIQFKQLRMRHTKGEMIHSNESDRKRFYDCPPYYLFAFESEISPPTLLERLASLPKVIASEDAEPLTPIDAAFLLSRKAIVADYGDGQGALAFRRAGREEYVRGFVLQEGREVLASMMLHMNAAMPKIRRFTSIALQYLIDEYE